MSNRQKKLAIVAAVLIALLVVTVLAGRCGKKKTDTNAQPPGTHKPPINPRLESSGGVPSGGGGGASAQNQVKPEPGGAALENANR